MFNKEREQEIISILKATNGFVSVKHLCDALFASESSIRRDLKALERRGLVKRNYGGASLMTNHSNIVTFNHRTRQNIAAKREIAKKAAALIKDGNIIFLDQSSTAFYLANELINRNSLTVVTNNIEIMMLLSNSGIKVISSGGLLSPENRSCLIGDDAKGVFENIYSDALFFSAKSLSDEGVISDCTREEVVLRNSMFKNSAKKIFLCNSEKFGTQSAYKQCTLSDIDYLVCENEKGKKFTACSDTLRIL